MVVGVNGCPVGSRKVSGGAICLCGTVPTYIGWYLISNKELEMTFRATIAATILLAGTALAVAQTVVITPEQEVVVREYVKTNPVVVERPSNFELILGAVIPDIFKPGELAENTLPDKYQYVVIDGRTVLIDPKTHKVVHIMN